MTNFYSFESKLLELSKEPLETNSDSKKNLHRFGQSYIYQTFYPAKIICSFTLIFNKLLNTFEYSDQNIYKSRNILSSLARHITSRVL